MREKWSKMMSKLPYLRQDLAVAHDHCAAMEYGTGRVRGGVELRNVRKTVNNEFKLPCPTERDLLFWRVNPDRHRLRGPHPRGAVRRRGELERGVNLGEGLNLGGLGAPAHA